MREEPESIISKIAEAQTSGEWDELESLLTDLAPSFDDHLVEPLLMTLVDDVLGEEQTFGIVHLAESVSDDDYVEGLLRALVYLSSSAPRWSRILLARVVNSTPTFTELLAEVANTSLEERRALAEVARALEEWRPEEFKVHSEEIRQALAAAS
jgi:hypothetical protein